MTSSGGAVFRFAPSPNGWLHLGHAFSALFTERAAEQLQGAFLLRIEDIDPARSKPAFETGIIEDLGWLGLTWPQPVSRQSTRMKIYGDAAEALRRRGLLYPCFCSRQDIALRAMRNDPDGAPVYDGGCRILSPDEALERIARGEPAQWRIEMDRATALCGTLSVLEAPAHDADARWSETAERLADPRRWGDAVIVRKDTPTSYHLSVVVDDADQGVTHVTRGMDLYRAAELHVLLQRLLGFQPPVYCHHRLLQDRQGQKLAKSKNSPSLRSLRERGSTASEIRRNLGF